MVILYILLFFLILGIVVCIHEFGHFFFAKKAGILVNEFAFGMGPKLLSKKKGETTWSLRAFPIGGFCAMSGETQDALPIQEGSKVRLVLNSDNKVKKIILDIDNPKFKDLELVEVFKLDLFGKDNSPLYINDFEVLRNAMLVFKKEEELQIAPEERNFFSKSVWQRFLVCFGGPLNNILLSLILFILFGFLVGVPINSTKIGNVTSGMPSENVLESGDELIRLGNKDIESYQDISIGIYETDSDILNVTYIRDGEERIGSIKAYYVFESLGFASSSTYSENNLEIICETEAALGGTNKTKAYQDGLLRNGDKITGISKKLNNGSYSEVYSLTTFNDLKDYVERELVDGGTIKVTYIRDGVSYTSDPFDCYSLELLNGQGYNLVYKQIGIESEIGRPFLECIVSGLESFASGALIIFNTLKLLFTSKEVGLKDMGGFITILNQTASYAQGGFTNIVYWVALLSINLGIVNLLPIPALDGGRILLLFIEGITGKKLNPKVENILITGFFILLMALIVYILFQDIFRMFIQLK